MKYKNIFLTGSTGILGKPSVPCILCPRKYNVGWVEGRRLLLRPKEKGNGIRATQTPLF